MADFLEEFQDQQTKSLKGRHKTYTKQIKVIEKSALDAAKTDENKATIKDVISQITTAMSVGSTPKREAFIDAAKELSNIQSALSEVGASDSLSFDSELLKKLQEAVQVGLDFIAEQKPSLKGAAAKGIANKMKETSSGFVKGMAMEAVSGIPFGAAVVDWMGAKMSGFGESLTQGKKLTETELGIGRAFSSETAEETEDIVEDVTKKTAKANKETAKSNGGVSTGPTTAGGTGFLRSAEDFVDARAERLGGITEPLAAEGAGGGLAETNEILKDILLAVTPDDEAEREARRLEELRRLEDAKKGIGVGEGKPEDKKGFFGDLFKNFKLGKFPIGQFLGKGGIGRLVGALGTSLLGGATVAAGPEGALGKEIVKSQKWGQLGKGAGVGLLLAGVALAIKDGMVGYAKSEEWGVSKFSGALGAALGGEDKGLKGAMWGGMKWALIGAGIGSVFPVIGTVIGGALGALLGAILGYFGGEKLSKAIDAIGTFFEERWNAFLGLFGKDDKAITKRVKLKEMGEERMDLEKLLAEEEAKEGKSLKEVQQMAVKGKGVVQAGKARREATLFDADKVTQLKAQISAAKVEEKRFMETGIEGKDADLKRRAAELPALIESAKKKKTNIGTARAANWVIGDEELTQSLTTELNNLKAQGFASGGFIVNRPSYLPSSGVIVGESKGYSGGGLTKALDGPPEMIIQGAAGGMLQSGGGSTQVYPLGGPQAEKTKEMFQPIAKSIAGATMNQMAMDRVGMRGPAGMGSAPTIIDASTVQNVSNNTLIRPPSPSGPGLHFERGDFVHKIA